MELVYHKGRNFGDALNPLIFHALFPGFFDQDPRTLFIGIGSIIGLKKAGPTTERRIYFSSGFAAGDAATYGTAPTFGPTDDVVCVRGPLTAQALGLPPEKAIADGAILLRHVLDVHPLPTTLPVAYMPHVGSYAFFSEWEALLREVGVAVIDPRGEPKAVLDQVRATGVLLAEAMHGAIVADTVGVPWVPVAMYDTINAFKWQDFTASMELSYAPNRIAPLFGRAFLRKMFQAKLGRFGLGALSGAAAWVYGVDHPRRRENVLRAFEALKQAPTFLSERRVLDARLNALLERAEYVRRTYA